MYNEKTANPNANEAVKTLYQKMCTLKNDGKNRVLSGVFSVEQADQVNELYGIYPAILGVEYCYSFGLKECCRDQVIDYRQLNPKIAEHYGNGGIVRVLTHFPNPCNPHFGGLRDKDADIDAILTDGTPARDNWLYMLDEIAAGFHKLEESGTIVIYGPLHENQGDDNSDNFWWCVGQKTMGIEKYIRLWKDIFHRICVHHKCGNVLLLWAPLGFLPESEEHLLVSSYPGDEFVDFVGLDVYDDSLLPHTHNYLKIMQHSKPFILSDFGPVKYYLSEAEREKYDCRKLLDEIKSDWQEMVGFMFWYEHFSITENLFGKELLEDEMVINRYN